MTQPSFVAQLYEDLPPDDVERVLVFLRQDLERLSAALQVAAASGDANGFRTAAHAICGAAGAVGVDPLEQMCRVAMTQRELDGQMLAISAAIMDLVTPTLASIAAALVNSPDHRTP